MLSTNKEKLITIIFPSRSRIELVKKLLISFEEKTYNKDWIEVISICDHDDEETLNLFHEISSQITYDFKFISRKQNEELDLPNDYYSLGLKLASDSYFTWILGNDCEISTENWDQILYLILEQNLPEWKTYIEENQKYFYFKINDDTHWDEQNKNISLYNDQSCCFPILSSNYCVDLKEFYPIEIATWGGDSCLYSFVKNSNKFLIFNIAYVIGIKHYSVHNQKFYEDKIFKRVKEKHSIEKNKPTHWENHNIFVDMFNKRKKFLHN